LDGAAGDSFAPRLNHEARRGRGRGSLRREYFEKSKSEAEPAGRGARRTRAGFAVLQAGRPSASALYSPAYRNLGMRWSRGPGYKNA